MSDPSPCHTVFETQHGHAGIAWRGDLVIGLALPSPRSEGPEQHLRNRFQSALHAAPAAGIAEIIETIRRYFAGDIVDFSDVSLDYGAPTSLIGRIYEATRRLRYGEATTYGELARSLGEAPPTARAVGQAMARNPIPLIIPCHRVLAAGGRVGGFSAPGGAKAKTRMLALEGIQLSPPPPRQLSLEL